MSVMDLVRLVLNTEGSFAGWVLLGFIAWFVICHGLARFGGWSALASAYPHLGAFDGYRLYMQTLLFAHGIRYGNTLVIGANHQGLYLAALFVMRPGHPPLLIPWEEISLQGRTGLFGQTLELRFLRVSSLTLTMAPTTAIALAEGAAKNMPNGGIPVPGWPKQEMPAKKERKAGPKEDKKRKWQDLFKGGRWPGN
jgi:hypothetical protein